MTTETKKPSERIGTEEFSASDRHGITVISDPRKLLALLDELHDRIAKLEAVAPPPEDLDPTKTKVVTIRTAEDWRAYHGDYPPPPAWFTEAQPVAVFESAPVGVYVGDNLGKVKGYEPEAAEPEPEA